MQDFFRETGIEDAQSKKIDGERKLIQRRAEAAKSRERIRERASGITPRSLRVEAGRLEQVDPESLQPTDVLRVVVGFAETVSKLMERAFIEGEDNRFLISTAKSLLRLSDRLPPESFRNLFPGGLLDNLKKFVEAGNEDVEAKVEVFAWARKTALDFAIPRSKKNRVRSPKTEDDTANNASFSDRYLRQSEEEALMVPDPLYIEPAPKMDLEQVENDSEGDSDLPEILEEEHGGGIEVSGDQDMERNKGDLKASTSEAVSPVVDVNKGKDESGLGRGIRGLRVERGPGNLHRIPLPETDELTDALGSGWGVGGASGEAFLNRDQRKFKPGSSKSASGDGVKFGGASAKARRKDGGGLEVSLGE